MAESFSREKLKGTNRRKKVDEKSCVTFLLCEWEENTHTHTHSEVFVTGIIDPPLEDQREWHRMTRMTRPDCAVMCNLINTHTHTHTQTLQMLSLNAHLVFVDLLHCGVTQTTFTYVCMVIHICRSSHSKSMDQPGKVANPARGQLNRET